MSAAMMAIWKFPLKAQDVQSIEMPAGATILTVQTQGGQPCLWAKVDAAKPKTKRVFETFGTGHPIPETHERAYLGTYQLVGGALVFHVYEVLNP